MPAPVQYITNEQGERIGVLLDWATYSSLAESSNAELSSLDEDCLAGLSREELAALASCKLAVDEQTRLDALLEQNSAARLSADAQSELDEILAKVDQLTLLKTRARYTLHCLENGTSAA